MMQDSKIKFKYNKLMLLIFIILYLPVLFARTDLWDGLILTHLINTGRNDVYFEWFNEAALFLTPWFYAPLSLPYLRDFYPLTAQIATLLFLWLSVTEVCKLSQLLYKTDDRQTVWVGVFYLLLPVWASYFSTIYLMHSATIFFSLLAVRLIFQAKYKVVAYLLVPVTFQQSSLAPFMLAMIMLWLIEGKGEKAKDAVLFGAWILVSFFVIRGVFATSGLYQDYNSINVQYALNIAYWWEFGLTVLLYSGVVLLSLLFKPRALLSLSFLGLFIALVVCVFPYIAVGKYTSYLASSIMHSNTMRFMFPAAAILAFILAYAISQKAVSPWFYGCVLAYMLYIFIGAQLSKVKDVAYQRAFISAIKMHPEVNGKVILFSNANRLTPYEYTDILEKAFGGNNSFPVINGNRSYAAMLYSKQSYAIKYNIPQTMPTEEIKVKVTSRLDSLSKLDLYQRYFTGDDFKGLVQVTVTR